MGSSFLKGIRDNLNRRSRKATKTPDFYVNGWKVLISRNRAFAKEIDTLARALVAIKQCETSRSNQLAQILSKMQKYQSATPAASNNAAAANANKADTDADSDSTAQDLIPHISSIIESIVKDSIKDSNSLKQILNEFLDTKGSANLLRETIVNDGKKHETTLKSQVKIWEASVQDFSNCEAKLKEALDSKKATEETKAVARHSYERALDNLESTTKLHSQKVSTTVMNMAESSKNYEDSFSDIINSFGGKICKYQASVAKRKQIMYSGFEQSLRSKDYVAAFMKKHGPQGPFSPKILQEIESSGLNRQDGASKHKLEESKSAADGFDEGTAMRNLKIKSGTATSPRPNSVAVSSTLSHTSDKAASNAANSKSKDGTLAISLNDTLHESRAKAKTEAPSQMIKHSGGGDQDKAETSGPRVIEEEYIMEDDKPVEEMNVEEMSGGEIDLSSLDNL